MDRDGGRAAVNGGPRDVEVVAVLVVPAQPDLHRHGDTRNAALHRLHQPAHAVGLPAEGGAKADPREAIDRAAEVEIDEIRSPLLRKARGPRQLVRLVARQLDAEARLIGRPSDERELGAPLLPQAAAPASSR